MRTATTGAVNAGLVEVISAALAAQYSPESKAYRQHTIPSGGIPKSIPAVRIEEGAVRLVANTARLEQDIVLLLLYWTGEAGGDEGPNVLDELYVMSALMDHALIDHETPAGTVDGTIGGVAVMVNESGQRAIFMDDDGMGGYMVVPLTLSYARLAGEA